MSNVSVKIAVPTFNNRPVDLAGWLALYSPAEACEIFNRYCDEKERAAKYRVKSAAELKAVKAFLKEHPEALGSVE